MKRSQYITNVKYKEKDVDVELCAFVNKIGKDTGDFKFRFTEPVSMMACTMVYGDFSNISYAYRSFAKWLQENSQYKMKGSSRQIVHRGPWNEKKSRELSNRNPNSFRKSLVKNDNLP